MQASDDAWREAAEVVRNGGLVAFPTDTVYGIGCDPYNVSAIQALYAAKARNREKAIPLLLSGPARLSEVALEVPVHAQSLAQEFWPGALTLVILKRASLPAALGSERTVAVRVPNHDALRDFIETLGGAIAASSANLSGEPDALEAEQVTRYFGDHVDLVIDGGRVRGGVPSTVVDCTADPPVVLREGAISKERLNPHLGKGSSGANNDNV